MLILVRGGIKVPAIMGPLGLFCFFTIIGLAPSFLLPAEQAFQAVWWGVAFGAPAAILVLALTDPEPDYAIKKLLTLSWVIGIAMMVAIILALPVIGGPSFVPGEGRALHMGGSFVVNEFAGMAGPRSTGLGRYAAVAALAALGRLGQERGWVRLFWIMMLPASLYVLVVAQGRTEILAFVAGAFVILALRRMSRLVIFSWGIVSTWLLATGGFLQRFWQYGTRGGRFDPTLSGRMATWRQGWEVFNTSPWVGLGFHADRWFLAQAQHIHNGWLHALLESGVVGTTAFVAAFVVALAFMVRLYWLGPESRRLPLLAEVPGMLIFFTVMNVTESTAYFSANWLLLAPVMAYLQLAFWKERTFRFGIDRRLPGLKRSRPLVVANPGTSARTPHPPAGVAQRYRPRLYALPHPRKGG
jgi:O-antigen ligase